MEDGVLRVVCGEEGRRFWRGMAELRMAVFREFPYLYEGSLEYEEEYLGRYFGCGESVFVLIFDAEERLVGCSTGMPLERELPEFREPFERAGLEAGEYFYFGESVLAREFRGRGIGHRFFDERERFARELGRFRWTTFCAVERPEDHPLRPGEYRALDAFWRKRGYEKTELRTMLAWPDLGEREDSEKPMAFWRRELR